MAGTQNGFSTLLAGRRSVSADKAGNLYIADPFSHVIRKIALNGTLSVIAGTGISGFTGDNGPAEQAKLNSPSAVFAAANGVIYVGDSGNFRVRTLNPVNGGAQYTITTFFGGMPQKDCTGQLEEQISLNKMEGQIISGLSKVCAGQPTAIQIQDTCENKNGNRTIVLALQHFSSNSNFVKITHPCSKQ